MIVPDFAIALTYLSGSGKTTQCSSFILEDAYALGYGDQVSILCTQPRRVAAISVAERVAEELGEANVGGLVGYSIRLESRKSQSTRLLFCTTGIILRRLVEDPNLEGISHLVLDEVHERQWQIDVLFTCVKLLLRTTRPDLKVVLVRCLSLGPDSPHMISLQRRCPLRLTNDSSATTLEALL